MKGELRSIRAQRTSFTTTAWSHRRKRIFECFSSKNSSFNLFQKERTSSSSQTIKFSQKNSVHPENASVGEAFLSKCLHSTLYHPLKACRPVIPLYLANISWYHPEYPAYAEYSQIACRRSPAHGLSVCFLWRLRSTSRTFLAFFFLERKRERK